MPRALKFLTGFLVLLGSNSVSAQVPMLLRDVNERSFSTQLTDSVVWNNQVIFGALGGVDGVELWRTDGTPSGTVQIADLRSGGNSSTPREFVVLGGEVVFSAASNSAHRELWRTDGTEAGTYPLTEFSIGGFQGGPSELTVSNGRVFFRAERSDIGVELFAYDGNVVELVADVRPGSIGSEPNQLVDFSGTLFFTADDGQSGRELWQSGGTAGSTQLVVDLRPGPLGSGVDPVFGDPPRDGPEFMTLHQGELYFVATDATTGAEVWKSDGSAAGTTLAFELAPDLESFRPEALMSTDNYLFFTAENPTTGRELYRTDGTAAETVLLEEPIPGPGSSAPQPLGTLDDSVFYVARSETAGLELYRSDGTVAGTFLLMDIWPGAEPLLAGDSPSDVVPFQNGLAFSANDGTGRDLWFTDGSIAGTDRLPDANPTGDAAAKPVIALDQLLLFQAVTGTIGNELWSTELIPGTANLVRDLNDRTGSSQPGQLTAADGVVFFSANDTVTGSELWKTDGVTTEPVADIYPGSVGSSPDHLATVGPLCFFSAVIPGQGRELHVSDGTEAGTAPVADINPGGQGSSPESIVSFGSGVIFSATSSGQGQEPWFSDGTELGTVQLRDIRAGSSGSDPRGFVEWNGAAYFVADDGEIGRELWRTDGTPSGTELVLDIRVGPEASGIDSITVTPAGLFFVADDGLSGPEIWKSDGTASGTVLWAEIRVGRFGSHANSLTWTGSHVVFSANDGEAFLREPWAVDPTTPGATLLADIAPGFESSGPRRFVRVQDQVYFFAGPFTDFELWVTEGTPSTTRRSAELPEGISSLGSEAVAVNDSIVFSARLDSVFIRQLFVSDGSSAGTYLVQSLMPGFGADNLTPFEDRLILTGDDPLYSREPWTLVDFRPPAVQEMECTSGDLSGCTALVTWRNPALFDELRLETGGVTTILPGDATEYSVSLPSFGAFPVSLTSVRNGLESVPITCTLRCSRPFIRGDLNADANVDLADAVSALQTLFVPGSDPFGCEDAADADDDGLLTIGDPIEILNLLFLPGSLPLPPPASCGDDPTLDDLSCFEGVACP